MTHPLAVLTLLALVGCGSPSSPTPVELGKSFDLKPGQTATVEGLQVTFFRVDDDSRCPKDVACVWEGDAAVKLRLSQGEGAKDTRELHSSGSVGPRRITYSGYEIELGGLRPQPHSSSPVKQDDYRVTLTVRRAASPAP
jgi:hypothetical protein